MPLDGSVTDFQTTTEPSLEGLIRWLEGQDPETEYCYEDHGHCLAAEYNRHIGQDYLVGTPRAAWLGKWAFGLLPEHAKTASELSSAPFKDQLETIAVWGDRTYGAALQRARALSESVR